MKLKVIDKISALPQTSKSEAEELVNRLYELGLRPGLEVKIVGKVSFGSVTIIQFGQTRLALNKEEMSCLHGL